MGMKEMINQRVAAHMAARLRQRAETTATASTSNSASPRAPSVFKKDIVEEFAGVEIEDRVGERPWSTIEPTPSSGKLNLQTEFIDDHTLLEAAPLPPKTDSDAPVTRVFEAEILPEGLQWKETIKQIQVAQKQILQDNHQLQSDRKAQEKDIRSQTKPRPLICALIEESEVQQSSNEETLDLGLKDKKLGDVYSSLLRATKRKRVYQEQDETPLSRKYAYNANGSRQLLTQSVMEDNKTLRQADSLENETKEILVPEENDDRKTPLIPKRAIRGKIKVERVSRQVIDVGTKDSSKVMDLSNIQRIIQEYLGYLKSGEPGFKLSNLLSGLRSQIQMANLAIFPNQEYIEQSKVLDQDALPQLFSGPNHHEFPWDLRSDGKELWARLKRGELDGSLMRGIVVQKSQLANGKHHTSRSLDETFPSKKVAAIIGANGLFNGQWWESRTSAIRDGAHGVIEAGIYGGTGMGAVSIVIGSGGYANDDNGETVKYCGTASKTSIPKTSTKYLEQAFLNSQPVRVLRATNAHSKFAPKYGIRYDGLYTITGKEVLDPDTARFRYTLRRNDDQDAIRYVGISKRPNDFEIEEMMKIKKAMGTA